MVHDDKVSELVKQLVTFSADYLIPIMVVMFGIGMVLRTLIYYTVRREHWFAKEFEKRVHQFVDLTPDREDLSFFIMAKYLLEKTYYELFEKRGVLKRRNSDFIMGMGDRIFLIQHGVAHIVKDTLLQLKYLKHTDHPPKLLQISKNVFGNNAAFSRVFGVFPAGLFNDVLNIIPGIFIVFGIFGTFLGIMNALPMLGEIDVSDVEGAKLIMDKFLIQISFSMSSSIVGIILSVVMTFFNTATSPEKLFIGIVNRFENCLDIMWNRSFDNRLPEEIPEFDENRDPLEVLASKALEKQLEKDKKNLKLSKYSEKQSA